LHRRKDRQHIVIFPAKNSVTANRIQISVRQVNYIPIKSAQRAKNRFAGVSMHLVQAPIFPQASVDASSNVELVLVLLILLSAWEYSITLITPPDERFCEMPSG
jgi:hypothetical protein